MAVNLLIYVIIDKYLSQRGVEGEKRLLVTVGGVAQQTRLQRALLLPRHHLLQLRLDGCPGLYYYINHPERRIG